MPATWQAEPAKAISMAKSQHSCRLAECSIHGTSSILYGCEVRSACSLKHSTLRGDDIEVWHSPLEYSVDWMGRGTCCRGRVCEESRTD